MSVSTSVEFIEGPTTASTTRAVAEDGLRRHAAVAAGAPYTLHEFKGQWVAAIVHEADFPGGPPEESGPPPQSAGPDDGGDATPPTDGPPSDGGDPTDGPPSDGGDESGDGDKKKDTGDKGGKDHAIKALTDLVTQIAQALGIPTDSLGGDPMDPMGGDPMGGDPSGGLGGPPPGPGLPGAGGPPGAGAPSVQDGGGMAAAHGADQAVMHMKALKPGETPPGATPAGASAFSSVRADHPWINAIGKVASFHTSSLIGDASLTDVHTELQTLANEVGYRVANLGEGVDSDGQRIVSAVITAH
jgi:hypothetical protein